MKVLLILFFFFKKNFFHAHFRGLTCDFFSKLSVFPCAICLSFNDDKKFEGNIFAVSFE